ncbi:L,D-transpeptidase family protein [Candidatus Finniella inopinata]|nr:L,D-transpeptidase family protein [Candidatus Finniella inopinata]
MFSFGRFLTPIFFCCMTATRLGSANEGISPPSPLVPQIQALEGLLEDYEKEAKNPYPEWTCTQYAFKKGDSDPIVRTVKKQLKDPDLGTSFDFDDDLEQAIIRFQKQHFLKPDGVIGKATCRALNMTVTDRIRKIKLNLKRWKKLSPLLNGRCVIVNVPTYHAEAMEGGQSILKQDIIVGMKSRATPLFSTTLTRVVLNPAWYMPDSIFFKDKLKKIQKDPNYLTRNFYVVADQDGELVSPHTVDWDQISDGYLPYRIRQLPGSHNALGRIKFHLEGTQAIYMHDTPQKELFQKCPRAFSSGCIRLSKPLDLALWALSKTDLKSAKEFEETIEGGQTKTYGLEKPLPVYFTYITVWVDENGQGLFSDDPYDLDEKEMRQERGK